MIHSCEHWSTQVTLFILVIFMPPVSVSKQFISYTVKLLAGKSSGKMTFLLPFLSPFNIVEKDNHNLEESKLYKGDKD